MLFYGLVVMPFVTPLAASVNVLPMFEAVRMALERLRFLGICLHVAIQIRMLFQVFRIVDPIRMPAELLLLLRMRVEIAIEALDVLVMFPLVRINRWGRILRHQRACQCGRQ